MTTLRCLLVLSVASLLATGCTKTQRTDSSTATSAATLSVQQELRAADPNAIIGEVLETLDGGQWIAIGGANTSELVVGDVVTFVSETKRTVGHGVVRDKGSSAVFVRLQTVTDKGRGVRKGDTAVRFRS
jgi:hypothetical protein